METLELFKTHPLAWVGLTLLIGYLIYMALKIRGEGEIIKLGEHQVFSIAGLQVKVPLWWAVREQYANRLEFHRADTHYEWFSRLVWISPEELKQEGAEEFLRHQLEAEHLEFDKGEVGLYDKESYQRYKNIANGRYHIFRIEGTATQGVEKRCYIDCFILVDQQSGEGLFAYSWSSILNGMLEGPYFQLMLEALLEG